MNSPLEDYVNGGHKHVNGWLDETAIELIAGVTDAQSAQRLCGGATEIGVHHGRLFILLHLSLRADERSAAWDLFERQSENTDASGLGDEAIFRRNLARHGCDTGRIAIRTANSLHLSAEEIRAACGGAVRLFSVDGGHTDLITANDLGLAAASVCAGGVVILDDFFNESWPGVAEGTCAFMRESPNKLIPFAIGGNKLLFTTSTEFASRYIGFLRPRFHPSRLRSSEFFGSPVMIVPVQTPTLRRRLVRSRPWRAARRVLRGTSRYS